MCSSDLSGQKIRIAADGRGGSSLSVWLPGRISGEPDRFFPSGTMTTAAECSARSWTFTDPARTYLITDLPCDAYLNPPPMGVVGRVTLSTPASPGVPLWCAE